MSDEPDRSMTPITRRVVLQGGVAVMLSAVLPFSIRDAAAATAVPAFFAEDSAEYKTLQALVSHMIPTDHEPGASEGNCAQFINAFLGAFDNAASGPAYIYAGGPFSSRGFDDDDVNRRNDFENFVPLDTYEALGWQIYLHGNDPANGGIGSIGHIEGRQALYQRGLAHLDQSAREYGQDSFAAMPREARELLLNDRSDGTVQEIVSACYWDTMAGMYGPPEYQGNAPGEDGVPVGWAYTGFDGDVHPRGYTEDQVVNADEPGLFDSMLPPSHHERARGNQPAPPDRTPISYQQALAIAARAPVTSEPLAAAPSTELMAAFVADADGDLQRLRAALQPYVDAQGGK